MADDINAAPSKKSRRVAKQKLSLVSGKLHAMSAGDASTSDLVRNEDERALLAAFRQVFDSEDRRYLIAITRRRAEAQEPRQPLLRLAPGAQAL